MPWYNSSRIDTKTNIECFVQDFKINLLVLAWYDLLRISFFNDGFPAKPHLSWRGLKIFQALSTQYLKNTEAQIHLSQNFSLKICHSTCVSSFTSLDSAIVYRMFGCVFRIKDFGLNDSIFAVLSIHVSFERNMNMMKLGMILVHICNNKRKV